MPRDANALTLGSVARAGFQQLSEARVMLSEVAGVLGIEAEALRQVFTVAADPDAALVKLCELARMPETRVHALSVEELRRLILLIGASPAFADFFVRAPERLGPVITRGALVIGPDAARTEIMAGVRGLSGEPGWIALRRSYRELLAAVMLADLEEGVAGEAPAAFEAVSHALSDLAAAALEAALQLARVSVEQGLSGVAVPPERLAQVSLAIIAMGKCGARELNVVSDVDVIFVCERLESRGETTNSTADPARERACADVDTVPLDDDAVLRIATRLASETMRAIHDPSVEPPLWQVDANLRPEGRQGPLVRSLGSMLSYYQRWAKTWEFQALLKARPVAGDLELGQRLVTSTRPLVWSSAAREDFVGSVQRMRERVTEHIHPDEIEVQLKLGPGGLRDIEFSVQLLQLVHGQRDEHLHLRGTLESLQALVDGGYVARSDGERLAFDYRRLRVIEHRLQLRGLRRTAIMPRDPDALRVLARATGLAPSGSDLEALWQTIKREVRGLHLKIFYAPLLGAVAALPEGELALGGDAARVRLASIGFRDPAGALRHLAALTKGTSRNAQIQRTILPVMLQWISQGTDPDFGLLAFRRVSEANRSTPWYLRLLRDGAGAAERLARVLACSRFAAELLEAIPEAVGWLERDALLQPLGLPTLLEEMRSLASRRDNAEAAAGALRTVHRREILRLALGALTGVLDEEQVSAGLDAVHTALIDGLLLAIRADAAERAHFELALIGMGRYGGRELGFASDVDLLAVYRVSDDATAEQRAGAQKLAERLVAELRRLVADARFAVDLDFDLRPEGKNGPIVRSFEAYRAYYERWSLTWEAQALIRARAVAGDAALGADFETFADTIRYPELFGETEIREVRRIKARVESERLPRGADPRRHLKLGPGGISDVEWLVQLRQLQHAHRESTLRTVSTLQALLEIERLGLLTDEDTELLRAAWVFASRVRSAAKLWSNRVSDVLPPERSELEGIAGVLGYGKGHTGELEDEWFARSRRARGVFEREFFGYSDEPGLGFTVRP